MLKRATKILTGLIATVTPALLSAQTAPAPAPAAAPAVASVDADPALWVIKDKDTTIYLFGTVHVLKPGLSWFDEGVKTAFDASNQLVLEMVQPDPAAMQALVMKTGFTTSGPTLTEKLPEKDRPRYTKALTDMGIPVAAFDRADPWLAATNLSLIPIMKAGYDPANGPETILAAAAKAADKPVIGLETAEQQIGYFDSLSDDLQVKFLVSTLDELPKVNETMETMVKSWSTGDPDALGRTMNEGMRATPEVGKILLADRNARWATWIDQRMKQPGTVFIAVGAGHLAGTDSVQSMLRKYKLKAVRVAY